MLNIIKTPTRSTERPEAVTSGRRQVCCESPLIIKQGKTFPAKGGISDLLRHSRSPERSKSLDKENVNNNRLMNLSQMFQGSKLSEMLKQPREASS